MSKSTNSKGGKVPFAQSLLTSPFWLIMVLQVFISGSYLMIKGTVVTDNIGLIFAAMIFMFLTLFGLKFLDHFKVVKSSFQMDCTSYVVGLLVVMAFLGLTASAQSLIAPASVVADGSHVPAFLDMGNMAIMDLVTQNLNQFETMWLNTIGAPIAEEMGYTIGIPAIIALIFAGLAFSFPNLKSIFLNPYVQIITFLAICAPLFAYTHVGRQGIVTLFIQAMVFRALIILVVYGDMMLNLIPYATIVASFAIGYHTGYNIFTIVGFDIGSYIGVMMTEPLGMLAIGINIVFFVVAAWHVFDKYLSRWF